jgi:hypothetical protein
MLVPAASTWDRASAPNCHSTSGEKASSSWAATSKHITGAQKADRITREARLLVMNVEV